MRTGIGIIAVLAFGHGGVGHAVEQEFQITPRLGFGAIKLEQGRASIDVARDGEVDDRTVDVGAAFGYVSPLGVVLEAGAQGQSNFTLGGVSDRLELSEQFVAIGYQLELGNGFRLTPTVGRARWRLNLKEGRSANPGPEARQSLDGYEDFWDVSLTKSVLTWLSMGARYRGTKYDFGRVRSTTFVVTFAFR